VREHGVEPVRRHVERDVLHAADVIAVLARQPLRVLEDREQGIVAHVEEVVPQVVVGRLPAVLLVGHAPRTTSTGQRASASAAATSSQS